MDNKETSGYIRQMIHYFDKLTDQQLASAQAALTVVRRKRKGRKEK